MDRPKRHLTSVPHSVAHAATGGSSNAALAADADGIDSLAVRRLDDVTVIEATGSLGEIIDEAHRAVLQALAEPCRGVICDLSGVRDTRARPGLRGFALLGAQARDWPAAPVAISCPGPRMRETLVNQPMSEYLVVTESLQDALSMVTRRPEPLDIDLRLAPHPTAGRAARNFVTRTCLDWGLPRSIASTRMVANELVTNALMHASTDILVSLSLADRRLRLAVRDGSSRFPRPERPHRDTVGGRGLMIVAGLSRAWGVLPTWSGGKVVWAVFDE